MLLKHLAACNQPHKLSDLRLDLLQRHIHKAHAARAEDLPDDPQEVLVMRILAPASSTPAIEYVEDVSLA